MGHALMENRNGLMVDRLTSRHHGLARVSWQFTLALAAYDLIRPSKLLEAPL